MINKKKFFTFSDNSFHTRGFTWAMSIHPRSEVVDRFCPKCGAGEHYPKGEFDVTLEGGSKYPDILGCGAYPFLIVSENVIKAWQEAGITCFHTYDVTVSKIKSPRLKGVPAPRYYRVEIDGSCEIDIEASGGKIVKFCPECHHLQTEPLVLPGKQIVPGFWDGSDLFRDQLHYPRVTFCTEKIVRIASEHRLTNFRFEPMEGPYDLSGKGIDYLPRKR